MTAIIPQSVTRNALVFTDRGRVPAKSGFLPLRKEFMMPQKSQENSRKNRAAHLEKFKFPPGQSGNPGGRPKNIFNEAYLRILNKTVANDPQGLRVIDAIAERVATQAMKGDLKAVAEITDRIQGRPMQAVSLGGEEERTDWFTLMTAEEKETRLKELLAKALRSGRCAVDK